jgi:hypothetical protein
MTRRCRVWCGGWEVREDYKRYIVYSIMICMDVSFVMSCDAVSRSCIRLHVLCDESSSSEPFGELTRHVAVLSVMYSEISCFFSCQSQ